MSKLLKDKVRRDNHALGGTRVEILSMKGITFLKNLDSIPMIVRVHLN